MKILIQVIAFIIGWILFWLIITSIAWFVNPGVDFRIIAGDKIVCFISIGLGWILGFASAFAFEKE